MYVSLLRVFTSLMVASAANPHRYVRVKNPSQTIVNVRVSCALVCRMSVQVITDVAQITRCKFAC